MAATGPSWGSLQAVGGEGRSFWLHLASPLGASRLLLGKWVGATVVGAGASFLGVLVVSFLPGVFGLPGAIVGLLVGPVVAAVMGLYTVGISATFPRFDWENPNQTVTGSGGLLLTACFFGLLLLGFLAALLFRFLDGLLPLPIAALVPALAWVVVGSLPGFAALSAGKANLERLEWEL